MAKILGGTMEILIDLAGLVMVGIGAVLGCYMVVIASYLAYLQWH